MSQPETKLTRKRGSWTAAEDQKLLELVEESSSVRWVNIAEMLGSRTSKQCRERYHQNLKPSLNHSPITAEEGKQIEYLVSIYGKRWAGISRHLKGRSDNAIKNWWNASANRRRSQSWKQDGPIIAAVPGHAVELPERRHSVQQASHSSNHDMSGNNGVTAVPSFVSPPSQIAPQVGVVFKSAYSEEPIKQALTPPDMASMHSNSTGSPSVGLTHSSPSTPSTVDRHNFAPQQHAQSLPPHMVAPVGPMAPSCPSAPPTVPANAAAVGPATHSLPAPLQPIQTPANGGALPSAPFIAAAQPLPSYAGQPTPNSGRLPAIETYLEERWRSMRKPSFDSAADLSRYSLSAPSYSSSPESRRSSIATAMPSDSRRSSYAVGLDHCRLDNPLDSRRSSLAMPMESRRGSYAPPLESRRGSYAPPLDNRRKSYALPMDTRTDTRMESRRGSYAPIVPGPRSPSPLPPLDRLPIA